MKAACQHGVFKGRNTEVDYSWLRLAFPVRQMRVRAWRNSILSARSDITICYTITFQISDNSNYVMKKSFSGIALTDKDHQRCEFLDGLLWFAEIVLRAQQVTLTRVTFFTTKAKVYDQFRHRLTDRQDKVIERMFREGPDGFKGGFSAEHYIAITGTSRATTTRDLQDLVEMGALSRTGERRHRGTNLQSEKIGQPPLPREHRQPHPGRRLLWTRRNHPGRKDAHQTANHPKPPLEPPVSSGIT